MPDILIKSFNRPFYLERCIYSIYKNVSGFTSIKIMDDGTPQKYLDLIQQKFPEVEILKSENYNEKVAAIKENLKSGKKINGFQIPTKLWISTVKKSTDYFFITEDDVWFINKIDLSSLTFNCKKNNIYLLKLGWLSTYKDDEWLNIESLNDEINRTIPKKLFLSSTLVMDLFFFNKFKFFSVLYRLRFFNNNTKQKYWALNSILMGLWKKEYWLQVWKNSSGRVNEKLQLKNASLFYRKHQFNSNFVCRLKSESTKTTFQSSATNSYHEYGFNFDVNYFNHLINEAWYNDKFDSMQNFPKDFSLDYFEMYLDKKIDENEFRKWVEQFKKQYKKLGVDVD